MIAHIRHGKVIKRFASERGWFLLENGDRVSPPQVGFVSGPDRIVEVVKETVDNSSSDYSVTRSTEVVESDRVVDRILVEDVPLKEWRKKASMPRKQWALISAENGWITETEALAWVGGSAIPVWVDRVIDTHIPEEQRLKTKLAVLDGQVIYRSGGLMLFLQAEQGVTDDQLDAYFGWTD